MGPSIYRGVNKGLYVLLSRTQAEPGRTVKQEQEEISRNHVKTFIFLSIYDIHRLFDPLLFFSVYKMCCLSTKLRHFLTPLSPFVQTSYTRKPPSLGASRMANSEIQGIIRGRFDISIRNSRYCVSTLLTNFESILMLLLHLQKMKGIAVDR